ncbi:MAG: hypothetical protein RLY31_3184 [Bacteroidota bacterium]|jgi:hypothetical protein
MKTVRRHPLLPVLLFLPLLLPGCENDINEVNRLFSRDQTLVETAMDVELLYSDSAVLKLRIVAPTLVRHLAASEPYQEFPDGLLVEFFDQGHHNEPSSRLTARYAQRFEHSNLFVARDSVVWTSRQQERLESEELIWDEAGDKVHTRKFVVMQRPGELIYGHGFESNQAFTTWRIRAIEGRIRSNELSDGLQH